MLLAAILSVADLSLEVYGDASEELREATSALSPTIYDHFQSI